jgi:hypothetical protein
VDESDGSRPPGPADDPDSYVERIPTPALAGRVRTVWVQQTGVRPYVQRNLPTGGVELHCPLGGVPTVIGPLTTAKVTLLPSFSTLVGVRFWPGSAAPLFGVPLDELVDRTGRLDWMSRASGGHLMGRTSCQMAGFWPDSTHPCAAPMNDIPKMVFSKTLADSEATWPSVAPAATVHEAARTTTTKARAQDAHKPPTCARSGPRTRLLITGPGS